MPQSILRLSLLGPPLVTVNSQPLKLGRKKALALLCYLAVTGRVQTRDGLAALFWPESSRARSNLRQTLWTLKKALGDNWLEMNREQVQLRSSYYLDVTYLEEAVAEAEVVLADETQIFDPVRLAKAAVLYRDTFLTGFTLSDTPEFDAWQSWQAELVEQKLGIALQLLIYIYKRQAAWETAIQYGQRWVALDPLHEAAHYELMQLYVAAGQKTAAKRQYEKCQQLLADELDVTPQSMLVELYQSLWQSGQPLRSNNGTSFQPKLLPSLPLNEIPAPGLLPPGSRMSLRPNPHFIGRQDELQQLARLLKIDTAVAVSPDIVVATGMGGIGKTQLAVEFAYRYGRFFPGGVFWLNCDEAAVMPSEIARCGGSEGLDLAPDFEEWSLPERVKHVQRAWNEPSLRLLIFDNCEDESLIHKWRPNLGYCRILITSRRGRWNPNLAITSLPLGTLERTESINLLLKLTPHLSTTNANQMAAELGDLPLALNLTGCFLTRYQSVSPAKYLEQLQEKNLLDHPSLIGRNDRYSPTGHEQHVARTFMLSYERLNPQNKIDKLALALLVRVAYFSPGEPIPRSVLSATLEDSHPEILEDNLLVEDACLRLIELGLLDEKAPDSVWLHRLLAVFVKNISNDATAQIAVAKTLLSFVQQLVNGSDYPQKYPQIENHLRISADAALIHQDELAADLGYWLGCYLQEIGDYIGAQFYLEQTLRIRGQQLGMHHTEMAVCLRRLGDVLRHLEQFEKAQTYLERALAIFLETYGPDHLEIAYSLNMLGVLLGAMKKYAEARTVFKQALQIQEKVLDAEHPDMIKSLNNLGVIALSLGELTDAQSYGEIVLSIRENTLGPQHPDVAKSLDNLGFLFQHMDQHKKALSYHKRASQIFEKTLGLNHPSTAICYSNVGITLIRLDKLKKARPFLENALEIRQKTFGLTHTETAKSFYNLGYLFQKLENYEEAQFCYERSLNIMVSKVGEDHPDSKNIRAQLNTIKDLFG